MDSPSITFLGKNQATQQDFDWGQLTWFANRELGNANQVTVGRCILKPSQGNPRHYHPNCTEWLTVLAGEIEHTGPGDEPVLMRPGDTVTIPQNIWHCAKNIGQTEAVLLIVFDSADRKTVGE